MNFIKIGILKCTQSCSISNSLYAAEFRSRVVKIRQDVCSRSGVLQHQYTNRQIFFYKVFCLFSALNVSIWFWGSKTELATEIPNLTFRPF